MTEKVSVHVGYTRGDIYGDYKVFKRQSLVGVDIKVTDGLGNELELNAREGDIGYRMIVNGKTVHTTIK